MTKDDKFKLDLKKHKYAIEEGVYETLTDMEFAILMSIVNSDDMLPQFVEELLPCPFCGTKPIREISNTILSVRCPKCVSVGFHTHIRFGCLADTKWNTRTLSSKEAKNV